MVDELRLILLTGNSCGSLTQECRYLVTELLGTDLNQLMRAKPLDARFAQFFMYQIMVLLPVTTDES